MYDKEFLDDHLNGAPSTKPAEDAGSWLGDAVIGLVCFVLICVAFGVCEVMG